MLRSTTQTVTAQRLILTFMVYWVPLRTKAADMCCFTSTADQVSVIITQRLRAYLKGAKRNRRSNGLLQEVLQIVERLCCVLL